MRKYRVLIGAVSHSDIGAITTIAESIALNERLNKEFEFIVHYSSRKYGKANTSRFNFINSYYLVKHLMSWCSKLIIYRPALAHYPITSYWNMEKSLLMLNLARLFGTKTIGHLHGGGFAVFWNSISHERKYFGVLGLNGLDAVIVASEYWKGFLVDKCKVKKKIEIIANPIRKEIEVALTSFKGKKSKTILYLGRIDSDKGIFDIIEAANCLLKNSQEYKFIIAGQVTRNEDFNYCKKQIESYQIDKSVILKGEVSEKEKTLLYCQSEIFLLPSYFENFPLSIIEAAAAGLAIIATPVGALPEYFTQGESILFVPPRNPAEIAKNITHLQMNEKLRIELGSNARKVFMNRLSGEQIMNEICNSYRSLVTK